MFCKYQIKLVDRIVQVCVLTDFFPTSLSVTERRVLESPNVIVCLSISCCISVGFCFVYFEALLLGSKIFRMMSFS